MKANELRIGNIFRVSNLTGRCVSFDTEEIEMDFSPGYGYIIQDVNPIPLTPEILEKCGFVNGIFGKFRVGYDGEDFKIWLMSVVFDSTMIKLHSLHQLQNLYFALTGEELKFEL